MDDAILERSEPAGRSLTRAEYDNAEKMAAKSDIFRYEICARFGGVYIDADFEPLRPIEPLLEVDEPLWSDDVSGG